MASGPVAIDTETTGLRVWTGDRPFAVSAAFEDGETLYWEWPVDPWSRLPRIPRGDLREVRELCCDPRRKKYFYHAKFDWLMLESIGVEVPIDTVEEVSWMVKACSNTELSYELKYQAKKIGIGDEDEKALKDAVVRARRRAKSIGWPTAEETACDYWLPRTLAKSGHDVQEGDDKVCETYARRDAWRTMLMGLTYEHGMDQLGVRGTYDFEMRLWPETLGMERVGVVIDEARMSKVRSESEARLEAAMSRLRKASGNAEFNLNSPKQIVSLLFGDASVEKLPVLKRTKTGQPKTDAEALAPHKSNPVVQDVFTARACTQSVKLFFDKYEQLATREDDGSGRQLPILHPGYNQAGTLTWRYTCGDPNLQQVSDPDTTNSLAAEFMVDIRQVFVPRPEHVWYCPDYSQIEVVIFADISGEPVMCDAIREGRDIHAATAEKVWGGRDNPRAVVEACKLLRTDDRGRARAELERYGFSITKLEEALGLKVVRKKSKSVTFTKIFGGGPLALMRWISVPHDEAVEILHTYDSEFPTMVRRMKEIEREGYENGYVVNPFGVRLSVDRWYAYRAVNHMVQSSAARLMKMGLLATARYLRATGLDARVALTIHDELILEFRRGHDHKRVLRRVCELMADTGGVLKLPIKVGMDRVSERWSEKEKVTL